MNVLMTGLYIVFLLYTGATSHDKQAVRQEWYDRFGDASYIVAENLPVEQQVANTNITAYRLVVNTDNKYIKAAITNLTITKFNNWKSTNLDNPNHFGVYTGADWRAVLDANGWETRLVNDSAEE